MNHTQTDRLSEIMGNFALLLFGSLVLPIFLGGSTLIVSRVVGGLIAGFGALAVSLLLLRGGEK